jgi:hypothetical protein
MVKQRNLLRSALPTAELACCNYESSCLILTVFATLLPTCTCAAHANGWDDALLAAMYVPLGVGHGSRCAVCILLMYCSVHAAISPV